MKARFVIGLIVALVVATAAAGQDKAPSQLYGELFEDVQMQRVFPDSKTFVDAVPHDAPAIIMQRYQDERGKPGFDLAAFVPRNFSARLRCCAISGTRATASIPTISGKSACRAEV
jgi:alpha,alpha-trehalase